MALAVAIAGSLVTGVAAATTPQQGGENAALWWPLLDLGARGRRLGVGSPPARVVSPKLGIDASVIPLGSREDRALQVPATASEAGWWSGGALPGEVGPR